MRLVLRTVLATATAIGVVVLGAVLLGLPSLPNPFASETVIRDHAAVLDSLDDLGEYHASTGTFQVVIDIEEKTRFVPGFLKGHRTTFLAQGSVDGVVDLDGLDPETVVVGDDGAVTVLLPAARLSDPIVDHEASAVLDRDRGLLDRVGGLVSDSPTSDRDVYIEAEQRLTEAAADSELLATAEENTRTMVTDLLSAAGIETVRVVFVDRPAAA